MDADAAGQARHGWESTYQQFCAVRQSAIIDQLIERIDSGKSQVRAWQDSVKRLRSDFEVAIERNGHVRNFHAVLEYELPLESRRPDAVLLMQRRLAVLEFKGRPAVVESDVDQVAAYARDLRNYHRSCHGQEVVPILVPMSRRQTLDSEGDVVVCSPDRLDAYMADLAGAADGPPVIDPEEFLSSSAYQPLPKLIIAARELFCNRRKLPDVWRSTANTDHAVECIEQHIADARIRKRRKLIFCTGVPGSGKTLVGLRAVHGIYGDDPGAAMCAYVSGNDPLVEVLRYMFAEAGGDGKALIKRAQDYIVRRGDRKSHEQVIVFDEAQRAHDADRVARDPQALTKESEPATLLSIARDRGDWSVVIALVGHGQAINDGEEGGIHLWREAFNKYGGEDWDVVGPPAIRDKFFAGVRCESIGQLHLDETIRAHFSTDLHRFAQGLVERTPAAPAQQRELLADIEESGFRFYVTRDLDVAKSYLHERYREYGKARYGLIASSRDKELEKGFDIGNSYFASMRRKIGPWLTAGEEDPLSCRHLKDAVNEFKIQGLELDAALLAWGTDFWLDPASNSWSIKGSMGYKPGKKVLDAWQLRANAYLVLLTRARDATVLFVPEAFGKLDATYRYLKDCGMRELRMS